VKLEFHRQHARLFEKKNIEQQIEKIYERKINLKGGGYIVIEPTEALVSIDVNTGRHTGGKDVEETVFLVNLEAAKEVPRQIRLRDLGGIIVIDFIDMKSRQHKRQVYDTLEEALKLDRSKTNILRISDLGLIEMTRQRTGAPLENLSYKQCPHCQGRGSIKSAVTMSITALRKLHQHLEETRQRRIELTAHPDVISRLLKEDKKSISNLQRRFRARINLKPDNSIYMEEIKINVCDR